MWSYRRRRQWFWFIDARARGAGAAIKTDPADKPWGDRMYTARDHEGHEWYFATPRR